MIKGEYHRTATRKVINQQLFSAIFLRELRTGKLPIDSVNACHQTLREWRREYPDLEDYTTLQLYIGQCLSTLELPYKLEQTYFTLYSDPTHVHQVGICLVVNDIDIGRMTKGAHYRANLIKQLRDTSLRWGMLTNGKRWRLCYTDTTSPYEVFFEIDLDSILEDIALEDLWLFTLFFGQQAFTTTSSTSTAGESLRLDLHIGESEKRTEAIQRYLRNNIESIVKSLCLGFVQDEAASTYTDKSLAEIYRNAIYLLFRLLFLFYGEARALLPVDHPGYHEISLTKILRAALSYQQGKHNSNPFSLWKQLSELCEVVDIGKDALGVNAYNGGLFSNKEKPYLKEHRIADSHLAPSLVALGYVPEKAGYQLIDYSDLSVRHLGTLYEGLLEYRLNLVALEPIVIRESSGKRVFLPLSMAQPVKRNETVLEVGQVYFADDKGERKSSGSYYTPEDVVHYIVCNTVLSLLQERRVPLETFLTEIQSECVIAPSTEARLRLESYANRTTVERIYRDILSLRILDPAMGSAHFLVAAAQVMTNFIVETLNSTSWPDDTINTDPLVWKRRVVERCLYGVDINPLVQELAKLSLWLTSATLGKPLTFLDHHLKVGNSLYGTPWQRLEDLPAAKKRRQKNLLQLWRKDIVKGMLDKLRQITSTDSDYLDDVKRKGEINQEAQELSQRLRDIAHVWLGTLFSLRNSNDKPIDESEYDRLLQEMSHHDAPNTWRAYVANSDILCEARTLAEQEGFFHWEIEFPDALDNGNERCLFDVVIANPPYVGKSPNQAIMELYKTARCGDLYAWFFDLSLQFTGEASRVGMIVPLSLTFSRDMKSLRMLLLQDDANTYISSFDASRDGIFQPSGESRNGQRASIVHHQRLHSAHHLYTTNLIRWFSEERPLLIKGLQYADITPLVSEQVIPKLGDTRLVEFWKRIRNYDQTITATIYNPKKKENGVKDIPSPNLFHAYVPSTARYFITAMPNTMRDTGLNIFSWENSWARDLAIVALNSNVFYWLWRVLGDGFHVTGEVVGSMILPTVKQGDMDALLLYNRLLDAAEECATYHNKWGERIPNYNFNERMDILLDIDEWIVSHIAPDLKLPRDIFAQYKSNSFLRSLDVSGILEAEVNSVVDY
jgi:hypothetical protein